MYYTLMCAHESEGSDTGRNLVHSTGNHRNKKSRSLAKMGVFYRLRMHIANKRASLQTGHAHHQYVGVFYQLRMRITNEWACFRESVR